MADHWTRGRPGTAALVALAIGQGVVWVLGLPDDGAGTTAFAWRALLLGVLYGAAIWIGWRRRDRSAVAIVLAAAIGFRLAALAWPPALSSDLYRYVWDGQVQLAGHSPYAAAPAAEELAPLRDQQIWPHINRPEAVTVYPPGAQLAFLTLARLGGDSVTAVKLAALGAELAALALLVVALRRRRLGVGPLILYAWSPLLIAEVCVSGHVDALVLPVMLGALLLADRRPGWSGALIGFGILLKLYPLLLLAAVPPGARRRAWLACAGVVVMGYLPYVWLSGADALGFLPDYVRAGEDFNPAVRGFIESALAHVIPQARQLSMAITAAGLAVLCGAIALRPGGDPFVAARRLALGFVLLLPTAVHPWYAVWVVPLVALDFSAAALWIICLLPLSYLKYAAPDGVMPAWIPLVEWLPALALLGIAWHAAARSPRPEAA